MGHELSGRADVALPFVGDYYAHLVGVLVELFTQFRDGPVVYRHSACSAAAFDRREKDHVAAVAVLSNLLAWRTPIYRDRAASP